MRIVSLRLRFVLLLTSLMLSIPNQLFANPSDFNFEWLSLISRAAKFREMRVDDDRLYLFGGAGFEILVYDIANAGNPVEIGHYSNPSHASFNDVAIMDGFIYLTKDNGMVILNAANPSQILQVGSGLAGVHYTGADTDDGHLYLARYALDQTRIEIYNLLDPIRPELVGSTQPLWGVGDALSADGTRLACNVGSRQSPLFFTVFDIANRLSPIVIGEKQIVANPIAFRNEFVYCGENEALAMCDLHRFPNDPLVAEYKFPWHSGSRDFVIRNFLAIVGGSGGLIAYDTRLPVGPGFITGRFQTPGRVEAIAIRNIIVYAADDNGLLVLRYTGPDPLDCDNNADVIAYDGPLVFEPGQQAEGAVIVKNTGSCPWTAADQYKLAITQDSGGLVDLPYPRVNVPEGVTVAPGEEYTFVVRFRAPDQIASFKLKFQMIQEFTEFFGEEFSVPFEARPSNSALNWQGMN